MTPQAAKMQAVSEIYELLRLAAAGKQAVAAIYNGLPRRLCPHVLGRKSGRLHVFCYQFGGSSNSGLPRRPLEQVTGAASPWRSSAESSWTLTHGTPSHDPSGRLASMRSISTPTLSRRKIRSRGNEGVGAATGAPR
jgi:hypothetical protein